MFKDLLEILKEFFRKLVSSRLFILGAMFVFLFAVLVVQLFHLQIIEGEKYQETYMAKTEKKVSLAGTRGNIYDKNGNLLAYNQLAYNVTIQDNNDYPRSNDKNLLRAVSLVVVKTISPDESKPTENSPWTFSP